jgi:hypothetical protein
MLTVDISGNGNTDSASLITAGGPGTSGTPGFDNVGLSSTHNASVTYLGGGWAITAAHVTIDNSAGSIIFGANSYQVDMSSIVQLRNSDNSLADLKIFRLTTDPGLPSILPSLISNATPTGRQILIGNGFDIGAQHYWHVNTIPPVWVWTMQSPPAHPGPNDASGFDVTGNHHVRWGENNVADTGLFLQNSDGTWIHAYTTQFDDLAYTGTASLPSEAEATNGDSGGAVFSFANNQWTLAGIMDGIDAYNNQPASTAMFGTHTYIMDLSQYRSQILADTTSVVSGRNVFYAGSTRYDTTGNSQTPLPFSDDNAIATDKSAYIPDGSTAGFGNYTSYSQGLNGIMVDLLGGGQHTSITLANILNDFTFKVGNNASPGTWANAPNPIAVTVRTNVNPASNGAGTVSGSDRVELIWADNAIQQQWLEVTVKATANTGLFANDVFFFGNEIGNTSSFNTTAVARTGTPDISGVQTNGAVLSANIPISNAYDFDRDGKVGTSDIATVQTHGTNLTTGLKLISIGSGGPFAPDALPAASPAVGGDVGVASALASTTTGSSPPPQTVSDSTVKRVNHLALSSGPIARLFEHLAHADSPTTKTILTEAAQAAESLGLDDELLDSLVVKLKPFARHDRR